MGPSNSTSVVSKEHIYICSLTFFTHVSKMNLQPNINFEGKRSRGCVVVSKKSN